MSRRLTIQEMQGYAEKHGGQCLSGKYTNAVTKLKWQCDKGHAWKATPYSIKSRQSWCPTCAIARNAIKRVSTTIEEMQVIAQKRGGSCLSKRYINDLSELKWKCANGHIWKTIPKVVKRGGWCPMCLRYVSENLCREIFQKIFKKKFVKIHPRWLINEHGGRMELDGYCKKLRLAFEYQGRQHYQIVDFFKGRNLFETQQADVLKKRLCEKEGIALIIIPYTVTRNELYGFITKKLEENNIEIPKHNKFSVDDLDVYSSQRFMDEMRSIAKELGGVCLSKFFIDSKTKLRWRCKESHEWEAIPESVKIGRWCPFCAKNVKLNIEEMHVMAKKNDGVCLSERYISSKSKIEWRCAKGHIWEAVPDSIRRGTWCPTCSNISGHEKLKRNIKELQVIAQNRGGKCMSEKYVNNHSRYTWRCAKGHMWEAIPGNIKFHGVWCPFCAGNARKVN